MDNQEAELRKQMDDTMAGLTGRIGELEGHISATARSVKDSVTTVRNNLDIRYHVRRRPWTLLAGATALGFLGGIRSAGNRAGHSARNGSAANTHQARVVSSDQAHYGPDLGTNADAETPIAGAAESNWFTNLGNTFQPEIAELRGIVIGTLLGIAREIITTQTPRMVMHSARESSDESNGKYRDQA